MNGTAPSLKRLASAYGLSRQGITDLSKRHGIDRETLQQPDEVLVVLLDRGRRSPLRSKLTDPATRAAISSQIQA